MKLVSFLTRWAKTWNPIFALFIGASSATSIMLGAFMVLGPFFLRIADARQDARMDTKIQHHEETVRRPDRDSLLKHLRQADSAVLKRLDYADKERDTIMDQIKYLTLFAKESNPQAHQRAEGQMKYWRSK